MLAVDRPRRSQTLRRLARRPLALLTILTLAASVLTGVAPTPASAAPLSASPSSVPLAPSPRFNQLWSVVSHNSYYFAPPGFEFLGSGPSQHILDDLYIDRLKGVEFDLHPDTGNPDPNNLGGRWGVYHTNMSRGDGSLCTFLELCLNILRAYHFANPDHDPITIRLESKTTGLDNNFHLFQGSLTPAYLDGTLTRYLHDGQAGMATTPSNDWVFGPADYYRWCQNTRLPQLEAAGTLPVGTTLDPDNLKDAVKKCGWPTLAELKGKFIVNLFGNDPGITKNSDSVLFYSHGDARTISQMKIFPEATITGKDFLHFGGVPCGFDGVCDWNSHTVFAELTGPLDSGQYRCQPPPEPRNGGSFDCYLNPSTGNVDVVDVGRTLSDFIAGGGIMKADDRSSLQDITAALQPFPVSQDNPPALSVHGFNYVSTDAPRNMPVNDTAQFVSSSAYMTGPVDWSYGCLWDTHGVFLPGCNGPLHEQHDSLFLRAQGIGGAQLSSTAGLEGGSPNTLAGDDLVFLNMPRDTTNTTSLRAFVSTRKGQTDDSVPDFGPTYEGNMGCVMARADLTDARAPFFALCRYGHRNGGVAFGQPPNNDGLYIIIRTERNGPLQAVYSDQNPPASSATEIPITHQGNWELQPSLRIQPNQAGTCWTGFTRSTDDPSPEPGWGEVSAGPQLCTAEPLNFIGLATDGGREQNFTGEYDFANVRYDGKFVTVDPTKDGTLHLITTQIGPSAGPVAVQDRSYFDHDLALNNVPADFTVNATNPTGAVVSYTPPTAADPSDGTSPPVSCVPAPGSAFLIGTTTVTCSASDAEEVPPTVSGSFVVTVKGAAQQLADLLVAVRGVGPDNSLAQLVTAIQAQLAAGRIPSACNLLRSFIARLQGWAAGHVISQTQASQLLSDATRIAAVVGCT